MQRKSPLIKVMFYVGMQEQFPLHETINFTRKEKNIPPPGL